MSYYREISFPVCASSQGLPAPFTFAFSPFSPSLLLSVLWKLEIPLSGAPSPFQPPVGEANQGRPWARKPGRAYLVGSFIHSLLRQALTHGTLGVK